MMRFVSFNVNGLRARIHQLHEIINKLNPDVIGLQETKVHDDLFPIKDITQYGYHAYYYGQKKYYGVALCFKKAPLSIMRGLVHDENCTPQQKRTIMANITTSIGILTIINVYFPQGENKYHPEKFEYKRRFYQNLHNYIKYNYHNNALLLIMGDMNISPTDLDVGISEKNKKKWIKTGRCSFLPEERTWINYLINWGLIDVYRHAYPQNNKHYSWFSYKSYGFKKNNGLRIDLMLATKSLMHYHKKSSIDYEIRNMQKPSDHAPIWSDFDI